MILAFTQNDLDTLDAAIASGVLKVKYKDKEVTYASMDDLLKARALVLKSLGKTTNESNRIKTSYRKGFTKC